LFVVDTILPSFCSLFLFCSTLFFPLRYRVSIVDSFRYSGCGFVVVALPLFVDFLLVVSTRCRSFAVVVRLFSGRSDLFVGSPWLHCSVAVLGCYLCIVVGYHFVCSLIPGFRLLLFIDLDDYVRVGYLVCSLRWMLLSLLLFVPLLFSLLFAFGFVVDLITPLGGCYVVVGVHSFFCSFLLYIAMFYHIRLFVVDVTSLILFV